MHLEGERPREPFLRVGTTEIPRTPRPASLHSILKWTLIITSDAGAGSTDAEEAENDLAYQFGVR